MVEWELKAESQELSANDYVTFHKARIDYFLEKKLNTLALKQKSRVNWAADGDENIHFFHGVMRGRLKKNTLQGLSVNNNWIEDPASVKNEIYEHFKTQFSESLEARPKFVSDKFKSISDLQAAALECSFTEEEIKQAVWSCEGSKALAPMDFRLISSRSIETF